MGRPEEDDAGVQAVAWLAALAALGREPRIRTYMPHAGPGGVILEVRNPKGGTHVPVPQEQRNDPEAWTAALAEAVRMAPGARTEGEGLTGSAGGSHGGEPSPPTEGGSE